MVLARLRAGHATVRTVRHPVQNPKVYEGRWFESTAAHYHLISNRPHNARGDSIGLACGSSRPPARASARSGDHGRVSPDLEPARAGDVRATATQTGSGQRG